MIFEIQWMVSHVLCHEYFSFKMRRVICAMCAIIVQLLSWVGIYDTDFKPHTPCKVLCGKKKKKRRLWYKLFLIITYINIIIIIYILYNNTYCLQTRAVLYLIA